MSWRQAIRRLDKLTNSLRDNKKPAGRRHTTDILEAYQYSELADPAKDIRLLELLPGQYDDALRIRIIHETLVKKTAIANERMSLRELREVISPHGWTAYETLEGRFVFSDSQQDHHWECPVLDIPPSRWQLQEDEHNYHPRYEALSYMWGEADNQQVVIVEPGQLSGPEAKARTLLVRNNLATALRHLRERVSSRILWIDAISINQTDDAEKPGQVSRIAEIFRSAYRVVAWLGPAAASSQRALEALDYIGKQIEIVGGGDAYCASPAAVDRSWATTTSPLPIDELTWNAIDELLQIPWFERLWVVQEMILSNHRAVIQCGDHQIAIVSFRRAIICLGHSQNAPPGVHYGTRVIFGLFFKKRGTLKNVLVTLYNKRCTDKRDHVYGALGLFPPMLAKNIRPDYSVSVAQAYMATTLAHMRLVHRLELLRMSFQIRRTIQVPSWVPDFSATFPTLRHPEGGFCSGISRAEFTLKSPDTLEVIGLRCAAVGSVGRSLMFWDRDSDPIDVMMSWRPQGLDTASYPTGDGLSHAYAITLMNFDLRERFVDMTTQPYLRDWMATLAHIGLLSELWAGGQWVAPQLMNRYIQESIYRCTGKAFIETDEGYIGLAIADAQPGKPSSAFRITYMYG